jgi:hypothetical protein
VVAWVQDNLKKTCPPSVGHHSAALPSKPVSPESQLFPLKLTAVPSS